jgi:glycosyltransferase involved in cell wall biosynthesis
MRVYVVDPPAFTPPYDHALCAALARAGAGDVELVTSPFAYGDVPEPDGYALQRLFYRRLPGAPGSWLRRGAKAAAHVPGMLALRRRVTAAPGIVHFQWLDLPWVDPWLLPRGPVVLTAHDLLPREPRPGQVAAQRRLLAAVDAVIVHSAAGRAQLVDGLGLDGHRVHVVPHGAFTHLAALPVAPLPPELPDTAAPVVLCFGLLRPYKGVQTLLEAWRGITGAELWVVGRPMMDLAPLRAAAPASVRFLPRFVSDGELAALFRRADLVVLPYARSARFDQSGVLATALAFGTPLVASDVGGFAEVASTGAARLVPAGDPAALGTVLAELIGDEVQRARLAAAARAAAAGPFSWDAAAAATLAVYSGLGR